MDLYYRFTHTADWFGFGGWLVELPLTVLWIPLVAAAAIAVAALIRPRSGGLVLAKGQLGVVGLVALAAMPMPVLVTTASGPETQAFILVHLLLAGALVEAGVRAASRLRTTQGLADRSAIDCVPDTAQREASGPRAGHCRSDQA